VQWRLYATIGQHVDERIDAAEAQWRRLYTNPILATPKPGCAG
jgi:hypothetical protein